MSVISTQARLKVAESAFSHSTELDMKEATKPKGMLEYLINMFTRGGVRNEKEKIYISTINDLRDCLHKNNVTLDNISDTKRLTLYSNGMGILLETNARAEETRVTVAKGLHVESEFVPNSKFTALCSSILLREKLGLDCQDGLLMPSGKVDLTDIHKTNLPIHEVINILKDLPSQVKYTLSNEYQTKIEKEMIELNKSLDDIFHKRAFVNEKKLLSSRDASGAESNTTNSTMDEVITDKNKLEKNAFIEKNKIFYQYSRNLQDCLATQKRFEPPVIKY